MFSIIVFYIEKNQLIYIILKLAIIHERGGNIMTININIINNLTVVI